MPRMSQPRPASNPHLLIRIAPWVGLAAVALAVYINALSNDFVWDDFCLILEDHTIKTFNYLKYIFSSDFFGHREDDLVYGYFRPLVSLSYAVDYALWQTNPFGYHLTNVILHAVATLLTAVVLGRMGLPRRAVFLAALLFAVHPMHTESVTWIAGRTDVIAFVLAMAAFVGHTTPRTGSWGIAARGTAVACFGAALLAKEMAVAVLPWIVIFDVSVARRSIRRAAQRQIPYGLVLLAYAVWRFFVVDVDVPHQGNAVAVFQAIVSAPWTVVRYLAWLAAPVSQCAYVRNPYMTGLGDIRLYIGLAAVAGAIHLFYRYRHDARHAWLLGLMLAASFVPILNLIKVSAPVDMGNPMSERFLYFPSFPFLALLALGLDALWRRRRDLRLPRIAVGALIVGIVAALSVATVLRNRVWKNNEVFYRATLARTPSALMWSNLANHYMHTGDWEAAKAALEEAGKFFSTDYYYQASMAEWHVAQRQYDEAIRYQKKIAAKAKRGRAVAYNNLAFLYRVTGKLDRAKALLEEIIYNKRGYTDVYFNLGEVHKAGGHLDKAIANYALALERQPDNLRIATALAGAYMKTGRLDRAEAVFKTQLEMHRDNAGLLNNIGVVYKKKKRFAQAVSWFERALEQNPRYTKARLNLADALVAVGKKAAAATELNTLIRENGDTPVGKAAAERLSGL